jgi:predicted PurR-regulated permease PerM
MLMATPKNNTVVVLLAILTVVAIGVVLKSAQSVIRPLIIAWLLSYIFGPTVNYLTERKVPLPMIVSLIVIFLMLVCYLGGVFLIGRIASFVDAFPSYNERMLALLSQHTADWSWNPLEGIAWGDTVTKWLGTMANSVVSFVSNLVLVMIFLVFLLSGRPYLEAKIYKAFSDDTADSISRISSTISGQISRYLAVQSLISLVTGILVYAVLNVLNIDFAITFGAMAFFLNFIPTIGSIIASLPPIMLAFVQYPEEAWRGFVVAGLIAAIQMSIGNVLTPKVMGDRLNLSPVVVLISLIFWGWLWGPIGAILSIPIAAALKIVCENIESLKPIGILMGSGRNYVRHHHKPAAN